MKIGKGGMMMPGSAFMIGLILGLVIGIILTAYMFNHGILSIGMIPV